MAKIVIEIPEEYAELGEAMKKFVEEIQAAMPDTRGGRAVDFAKFEHAAEQSAAALERETLRRLLQALDIDAERVVIRGKPHARVGRYEAPYATKAGEVTVLRSTLGRLPYSRSSFERVGQSVGALFERSRLDV